MITTYPDQTSKLQSRVAGAASKVAQSTNLASLQSTRSFTQALLAPLFAAASFTLEIVEQQVVLSKQLNDIFFEPRSKAIPVALKPLRVMTEDNAAPAIARKTSDDAAQTFVTAADDSEQELVATAQANAKTADDAIQSLVKAADDAAPTLVTTAEEDQEIQLRAERLVINKQRVQQGEARVRKVIVTDVKSIDVPVTHEELVIDRQTVTGDVDVDVDSAPIADETIRIPLTKEKVNMAKETVVREEVEIGKRRVEGVEHISETVRHEDIRVVDATPNRN